MGKVIYAEKNYGDHGKCIEISNNIVDLVVTLDVGPRIIRYGFIGQRNNFCESASLSLSVGDEEWKLRGGHRLWHSPEKFPRTYQPDNRPVMWKKIENGIRVISEIEPWVQVKKEMEIFLSPSDSKVKINHKITNFNAWDIELSAWALTVMASGGIEIIPQPQNESHFSDGAKGSRVITQWAYSRMNDSRICWGDKYITLKQDLNSKSNIKFGISNEDGWSAYINDNQIFVKKYLHQKGAKYPDHGVSYETFTNDFMLEMETLSPLVILQPEESVIHTEEWNLFECIEPLSNREEDIDIIVDKFIK